MGGRGASSGVSKAGNAYGSQYDELLTVGNVKYVSKRVKGAEPIMETMTDGRVYAWVLDGEIKSIIYFDAENKRSKQIDLADHYGIRPHAHHGYLHDEYSSSGKPTKLSAKEKKLTDKILKDWEKYKRRQ